MPDFVFQLGSLGQFFDFCENDNAELPNFSEELVEKGAVLLAPSRGSNVQD